MYFLLQRVATVFLKVMQYVEMQLLHYYTFYTSIFVLNTVTNCKISKFEVIIHIASILNGIRNTAWTKVFVLPKILYTNANIFSGSRGLKL